MAFGFGRRVARAWNKRSKHNVKVGKASLGGGAGFATGKHVMKKAQFKKRPKGKSFNKKKRKGSERSSLMSHSVAAGRALVVIKPKPKVKLASGSLTLLTSTTGSQSSNQNQRAIAIINECDTYANWLTTSGGTDSYNRSPVAWFEMNPARELTGSAYFSAGSPSHEKMLHTISKYDIQLLNAGNGVVECEIIVGSYKSVTQYDITALWNSDLKSNAYDGLGVVACNTNSGAVGYPTLDDFMFLPIQADPSLNQYVKIHHSKKFTLNVGSTENVHLDVVTNFMGDSVKFTTADRQYTPGAHFIAVLHYGQLASFSDNIFGQVAGNLPSKICW